MRVHFWRRHVLDMRRGQATDIPDRVPQGGGKVVSSGRVSGEGRYTNGDESALLEEARAGHEKGASHRHTG